MTHHVLPAVPLDQDGLLLESHYSVGSVMHEKWFTAAMREREREREGDGMRADYLNSMQTLS